MSDSEENEESGINEKDFGRYTGLKFVSFSKLVAGIGGDNARFSKSLTLTDTTEITFFTDALTKWNDQDHSATFSDFTNEIPSNDLQTYAQLLHNKEIVANTLLNHMQKDSKSKSIPAFCELLSSLARDLKDDFDEYIWPSFDVLTNILDCGEQEKDSVEAAYYALAILVKVLWKKLVKNIKVSFSHFAPLFGSRRSYVQRFAAESFSFIMRKLNNLKPIIHFIISHSYKVNDSSLKEGCGILLFNVYKGWSGKFHSDAEQLISEIIGTILSLEDKVMKNHGYEIIAIMVEKTIEYVNNQKTTINCLENVLLKSLESTRSMENCSILLMLLTIIFKEENLKIIIVEKKRVVRILTNLISSDFFVINKVFVDFISQYTFLISNESSAIRDIFSKVSTIKSTDKNVIKLALELFKSVITINMFELNIMPYFGDLASYIFEKELDLQNELLSIYAAACMDRKPLANVFSQNRSTFFDLSKHVAVKQYIQSKLSDLPKLDVELSTNIVISWPWFFSKGEKIEGAEFVQKWLLSLIKDDATFEELSMLCYVLGSSLFLTNKDMIACIPQELILNHIRRCSYSHSSLLLLQLYLVSSGEQSDIKLFKNIIRLLSPILSSPSASKRKTALEILSLFDLPLQEKSDEISNFEPGENLFKILLEAETTNVIDYRERLRHFRKLLYGPHTRYLIKECSRECEHILLRTGLSQFFVQFTVLWPGMHEFLSSYARGMNSEEFWPIIAETLQEKHDSTTTANKISNICKGIDENERCDFVAAKIQVLKFVSTISDLAEQRTKYLSQLLVTFCRDYLSRNKRSGDGINMRQYNKILCSFLDIYSKFSHAQNVYMSKELKEIYQKLLHYPDMQIMKAALACIFTYRSKVLLKYRENLEALVDEKKFKNHLILFKISNDEGDAVLLAEHREEIMPILLRILFGALQLHQNTKNAEIYRRSIFRFLHGCRSEELQLLIDLIIQEPLNQLQNKSIEFSQMETMCSDQETLNIFSLNQLKRAVLNILELLKRIPRAFSEKQQTQILQALLTFGLIIRANIKRESEEKSLNEARQLRKILTECFTEFFKAYTTRKLSNGEIQHFLSVTTNCYLTEARESDGKVIAVAPLSVLRMLSVLCKLPSFWPMLSILIKVDFLSAKISVFEILLSHLFWSGVTSEIVQFTRDGLTSLLTLKDEPSALQDDEIEKVQIDIQNENYGTALIVKHMQLVINFLSESLESEVKLKDTTFANLDIINRLCTYVDDESLGERMAQLLSAHLERKLPNDENLQKLLHTLGKLITIVKNPSIFLSRITRLFIEINGRSSREALASVLEGFIENEHTPETIKKYLPLVVDLESWDRRRIDEPDHDRRHSAYSKLFEMWTSKTQFHPEFLSLVIHANFHTLFTTTDIALRSNSASNIRSLAEHISKTPYSVETKQKLVEKNLISLMLRGFRHDSDVVREECIRCLATYVSSFPEHEQLSLFVPLQNKEEDLDFFSNLNHIQLHRRQRGINRLVNGIKEGKITMPFEVLYRFLIPIIYHYLVNPTSNTSAMSDECLRLFSLTFELSPWQSYISTLDHWLARLKKESGSEKLIVRVLVAIIDSFHFDVADINEVLAEDGTNNTAIVIRDKITKDVLPRLRKCINGKAGSIEVHKKAKTSVTSYTADEDDLMRAPVALATIKLLRKLPASIMNQHLHGVILKLCWLMNSRSYKVRETARKVTLQVCDALGTKYLPSIIKEMTLIMNKGFQIHVLIYTVHTFINTLQSKFITGDLDACLEELINLCIKDQFEDTVDEKEVGAIRAEVPEAKGNKTPETLTFLGKFITPKSLGCVLEKFQYILEKKASSKTVSRVGNLLSKFAIGIKENAGLSSTEQLIFAYQIINNNIEKMENPEGKQAKQNEPSIQNVSCLLIPEAPKRVGALIKSSVKSRVHVFVEFALQLLSTLISEKRIDLKDEDDIAKIEPFIPIIIRCLTMKYDKIISFSLRCLNGMLGMDIQAIKDKLKPLSQRLFAILADYSMIGSAANKHSVLQLNQTLFKIFTKIISLGDATILSKKNIALLLSYIEVDIMDSQKQATAFLLIKSIIRKRIEHERLPEVIKILSELSITSTQAHIRSQCRDVICEYVGNHPQAEDPKKWLEFFLAQLEYEFEDGRLSAAEILHKLFSELLQKVLDEHFFFCLVKLASRLVNDELPLCRKYVSMTLRKLLEEVSESSLEDAISAGCDWLESEKEVSRVVGIEILAQVSFVELEKFTNRLPRILENISGQISSETLFEDNSEQTITCLLNSLVLIIRNCGNIEPKTDTSLATIIGHLEPLSKCLESPKICLAASYFIGQCLSLWKEKTKVPSDLSPETIVQWMCWQLKNPKVTQEIADQASKNIVCLVQWLEKNEFESVIKRLSTICKYEIAKLPKEAIRRITSFKLAAVFAVRDQEGKIFDTVVQEFFPLLVREMNRKSITSTEELYNLVNEVGEIIKTRIGEKEYANRLSECQKKVLSKTEERKRKIKELAVTAPEIAAEVKRKKNIKKTQAKKRKLDTFKPYRVAKRQLLEKNRLMVDEE